MSPRLLFLFSSPTCELCEKAGDIYNTYNTASLSADGSRRSLPHFKLVKVNILEASSLQSRYSWSIPVFYKASSAVSHLATAIGIGDLSEYQELNANRSHSAIESMPATAPADKLETLIAEELKLLHPSSAMNSNNHQNIFKPIQDGGIKLPNELYWPFPPSRFREFLLGG